MSLTDDARLVVETIGKMRQAQGPLSVLPDGYDEACLRLATAYIEAGRVDGGGCPRCGCELLETLIKSRRFACGVVDHGPQHDGGQYVTEATCGCLRNQIANLTARLATVSTELADLKQRIAASPVAWVQFGNHNNPCEISEDRETFWDGEHPPGTLRQCRLLEVRDVE